MFLVCVRPKLLFKLSSVQKQAISHGPLQQRLIHIDEEPHFSYLFFPTSLATVTNSFNDHTAFDQLQICIEGLVCHFSQSGHNACFFTHSSSPIRLISMCLQCRVPPLFAKPTVCCNDHILPALCQFNVGPEKKEADVFS